MVAIGKTCKYNSAAFSHVSTKVSHYTAENSQYLTWLD